MVFKSDNIAVRILRSIKDDVTELKSDSAFLKENAVKSSSTLKMLESHITVYTKHLEHAVDELRSRVEALEQIKSEDPRE